ncbi:MULTISPECIES: ABC transporter permease [Clostridium]|uniref:Putative spermidine/putrescine ABC transporter, permease component n=2 Tax=Clostridium ljungdahlii TaxID=1538 RepID=D8GJS4_CLOLD|nr:putative spermidine/putrescine ABC transporter, permease component [Clostridium ljungdahlii DSM 13528]ALU34682.1 ABC-type transporter integral membrane subunit [Clostridium autoethanogenum DSM 10061]OAA88715.1 Spermidine/putrescine transport system permease protein PotB [Clostridium ljungdahlii DSM 13528]OVY51402.1 Spermidine/putrescine transport system permease protein PotB [Clostridium autoethanogenum]
MKIEKKRLLNFEKSFFIGPVSLWMIVLMGAPICYVIFISFLQRGTNGGIDFVFSLDNYKRIISPLYLKVFMDSLLIALITTLFTLVVGYPFAYLVVKIPKKFRIFVVMLIIVPFWTNSLIRSYAWMTLLSTEGLVNNLLIKVGFIKEPIEMLYTYGAVLIGMIYTLFPFMVLPLYTSIEKVNKNYIEAAKDLGATSLRAFLTVTLPLTKPGIVAGSILVFIPSLGLFYICDLMGGSKVMLIGNLIRNQFLISRDWPFGAALSVFMIIITLILLHVSTKLVGKKVDLEVF